MRHAVLRYTLLVAVAMLVYGSSTSYGRGPGGRGGHASGRAGGGPGGQGPELSQRDLKKNDGPNFGAIGGPNAAAQNFNGAAQKFQGAQGKWQNAVGGAEKFQNLQQQSGQKWPARNSQFPQNAQSALKDLKNGQQPFTANWYADHPAAWQYTHPHADAWAATTATGVAAWLGWSAQPVYGTSNTVVYQEAPTEESDSDDEVLDSQSESTDDSTEWLSIGVYSVLANSGEATSRFLQLAVNRQGDLRGVYYDATSNNSQNLTGRIDQATQQAQWSIDSNPRITFRASLDQLTQPTGTIEVNQPGGQQQWRITRQQNAG